MKLYNSVSSISIKRFCLSLPLFVLLFSGLFSCSHKIATEKLPPTQIVFGNGGGFAGLVHEYALFPNGQIIESHPDSAVQHIVASIGKKQAARFYSGVDSMRLSTWKYDVPGNIYHYIVLKKEGKKDNRIVWDGSGRDKNAPTNIEDFYKRLMALLPKNNN